MILALALIVLGYDLAYYSANVLFWAHKLTTTADPVPLRYCLGIPIAGEAGGDVFKPPFRLGAGLQGVDALPARAFFGEGTVWVPSTIGSVFTDIYNFFNTPGEDLYGTGADSTNPTLPQNGGGGTIGRTATGGLKGAQPPGIVGGPGYDGAVQGSVYGLLG